MSRAGTPSIPHTPPPRRSGHRTSWGNGIGRMRSDSSASAIIMTPERPQTPGGNGSRPVSQLLESEQDMADLTAEMALLDEGIDSRTGRTITSHAGGLRPLSLKYTPPPRPQSSSSSDGHDDNPRGGHSGPTFYTVGADGLTSIYSEKSAIPASPTTSFRLTSNLSKFLYRLRFILRLLSVMGAGCVLGVLAHVTTVFLRTREAKDHEFGHPLWPVQGVDLIPTNTLIAGAGACLAMGIGWTLATISKKVRRLDGGTKAWVRWIAAISALLETAVWVAVIVFTGRERKASKQPEEKKTLFHVCKLAAQMPDQPIDIGEIDFAFHCQEMRTGWFAAISVCIVTGLIFFTIVGGALVRIWTRRQKGKGRMLDGYSAAPSEESPAVMARMRGTKLLGRTRKGKWGSWRR